MEEVLLVDTIMNSGLSESVKIGLIMGGFIISSITALVAKIQASKAEKTANKAGRDIDEAHRRIRKRQREIQEIKNAQEG